MPSAAPGAATTTIRPDTRPAYQFVARLHFIRESWSAPVCVVRVGPDQEANAVATEQVEALLGRLEQGEAVPLFVFDAGYDPVKLQRALEGSACQILLRLRAGSRFYGEPSLCDPPATSDALVATGRR